MTKQDYTLYIYRTDRRCKSGERLFSTTVYTGRDDNGMRREVAELFKWYNPDKGWRFDWHPFKMDVMFFMTDQSIEIDRDTPWACNPASESYWSN
jgi:hypothetical protein